MNRRFLPAFFLLTCVLLAPQAWAKKKNKTDGVPVEVVVTDQMGQVIPTAIIRHPDEADRHRVNAVDGSWEASVLYMPDGSELLFLPGLSLQLEVSAPGYVTQVIQYDVRKRKNKISISLAELELDNEEIDEPMIQFGRDKPRESTSGTPAN